MDDGTQVQGLTQVAIMCSSATKETPRARIPATAATTVERYRVRGLSARLVSTTGTRAPRTNPAAVELHRYCNCLTSALPVSTPGTSRMSGSPAMAEAIPFARAASAEMASSKASGPSRYYSASTETLRKPLGNPSSFNKNSSMVPGLPEQ